MNELNRTRQILDGIRELRKRVDVMAARLRPLYALLGWTWRDSLVAPSAKEIGANLHRHLDTFEEEARTGNLEDKTYWSIDSGGLSVGFDNETLFLSFQLYETIDIELDPIENDETL